MRHSHAQELALITELSRGLHQAADLDEAITRTLGLLCEGRTAAAGLAWLVDPAGQWQLLATHGDPTVVAAVLAREPEPPPASGALTDAQGGHDETGDAEVRVTTAQGEPAAVLRLVGLAGEPHPPGPSRLLEAVAGLLSHAYEHLDQRARFEQAQQTAAIGSWEWRADTDEVRFSEQMYRNLGGDPTTIDHTLAGYLARLHPEDRDAVVRQVETALADGGDWYTIHRVVTDDGDVRCIEGHGQVAVDEEGVAVRLWGTGQDITERRNLEQELARRAERDDLTGLANRRAFQHQLQQALDDHAGDPETVAVALVDIDGFRSINEQVGWATGDQVLREVADRLTQVDRATLVARLSADEFAVLFAPRGPESLESLGEDIATDLRHPAPPRVDGRSVEVGIGVATNVDGVRSPDELMRAASVALQVAKSRTNARWQVFDPDKHDEALQRLAMESDLRRAVERGEIEVAYQPVLVLATGEISGVEALARWHRPGHGPVSPATFIPIAERTGLMRQLGADILEQACRQVRTWQLDHPRAADLKVGVNLSLAQLDDPGLVEQVEDVLAGCGLAPEHLVLEITESTFAHDTPGALARLFELRQRGVRVAIDDFGTGYSSLARLRELPFDILKIDRSFITDIASRHEPTPILAALFSITQSLELDVVAEGVETPVQLAVMLGHDCDFVQGFLFSRPVGPAELDAVLADEPGWDPAGIADQVPAPRTSPRLQELLEQLACPDPPPSPEVLDEILAVLAELTHLESVYVTRIDLGNDVQEILAARNLGSTRIDAGLQVPWSQTLCLRALADGDPVIADVRRDHPDTDVARELGISSYVGVEIHGPKGGIRGTLCGVTGTVTDIPQETVETLHWVARLLSDHLRGQNDRAGARH